MAVAAPGESGPAGHTGRCRLAALGLLLVLDLLSGADLEPVGVLWSLVAMVGCATYFVMSADESNGLPPIALAAGGMLVGATLRSALLGLVGLLEMRGHDGVGRPARDVVAWWVPVALLGVVTAAVSYVPGIAAIRRLGSRLASFVALLEVVSGVLWAWVLLDELPRAGPAARRRADPGRVVRGQARGERATARPVA